MSLVEVAKSLSIEYVGKKDFHLDPGKLVEIQRNLEERPIPSRPLLETISSEKQKLYLIQRYISSFEYNFIGQSFFQMRKDRGMQHIANVAKCIMREALPIQCVEGVFLAVYLTCGIREILRIPISFKTKVGENEYSHIILAIRSEGKWGALGISRNSSLMYKDVKFATLFDLVQEFCNCYAKSSHEMYCALVGLPFPHNPHNGFSIRWRFMRLDLNQLPLDRIKFSLNQYARDCEKILEYFTFTGKFPLACNEDYVTGQTDAVSKSSPVRSIWKKRRMDLKTR